MDAVWQVTLQFPDAFEFNEHLLVAILDAVQSGMYGNFLHSSEKGSELILLQLVSLFVLSESRTADKQEDSIFLATSQPVEV